MDGNETKSYTWDDTIYQVSLTTGMDAPAGDAIVPVWS